MGEDVLLGPARDIEQRTGGQEVEARFSERHPALARKPFVELFLERMKVANVARGIFALCVAELVRAPVAGLLLLGQIDVEQLLDEILEAMAVGIGTDQARCGARAVKRRRKDPEI